jgi:molybdopterin converting factor small subunit
VRVRVRLFASLREEMGQAELEIDLPASSTAEAAWQQLSRTVPAHRERRGGLLATINRRYAY